VETGFIETAISRRVFGACRKAFLRRKIVFLWGESQIGKTTALVQYTLLHNHGETVYVRMPTGGSIDGFLHALAEVLGIPTGNRGVDLQRRIMASFDDRMLLIVDEAHEALSEHYSAKRGLRTLNWVRELQERCKCGVVLSATNVFRDVMLRGPHARNLRQLWLRGMAPVQLPDRPCNADLDAFARAYGLGPATDEEVQVRVAYIDDDGGERQQILAKNPCVLQAEVIRAYSLGRWNVILQEASDIARERKRPLTWGLVIHAWHSFERMGQFDQGGAS
jgi:DNA transposition AAA+ family ATPase